MTLFQAFGQFASSGAQQFGLNFITHQTWTSSGGLSLDNVFSSKYDNYRILVEVSSTTGVDVDARLRASGTDNSTASSYITQRYFAAGTAAQANRQTLDKIWQLGGVSRSTSNLTAAVIDMFSPFLAEPTRWTTRSYEAVDGVRNFHYSGIHNQSTSYDGLTFLPPGTTSGYVTVYGLGEK